MCVGVCVCLLVNGCVRRVSGALRQLDVNVSSRVTRQQIGRASCRERVSSPV